MSGLFKTPEKLFTTVSNVLDKITDATEGGIGPYKNLTCAEANQLRNFVESFDDCLDTDDIESKDLIKQYDNLPSHVKDILPKSIITQIEKIR